VLIKHLGAGTVIISFVRSGGFTAAPGLRVSGTVTIDDGGASVRAEPSYRRVLGEDERQLLLEAGQALLGRNETISSAPGPVRDAYQFAFTVGEEGKHVTVTADSGSLASSGPLQTLIEWASREAASILKR